MVAFSLSDAAVLWFGEKPLKVGARTVLWPVWGWRVSAPGRSPRELDQFALHVLRLCRVGIWDADSIARRLGLDLTLIGRVMLELTQGDLITPERSLTESGQSALLDVLAPTDDDWSDGWVFQDIWTGELHPYFATELTELRREFRDNGRIKLSLGSMGEGRSASTFYVRPPDLELRCPDADRVIAACQRYRNLVSRGGWSIPESARARVAFLDERPEPFWLVITLRGAVVHDAPDLSNEHHWRPTDPFGLGREEHFRDMLVREAKLGSESARLLAETILRNRSSNESTDAYELMLERYGLQYEREPWFSATLEMERLARRGEHRHSIKEARVAIELALGSLLPPGGDAWRELYAGAAPLDRGSSIQVLRACAERVGFENVPSHIFRFAPAAIRELFADHGRNPGWRLGPTMAALILIASRDTNHRMNRVAQRAPGFFRQVCDVAGEGNTAVHEIRNVTSSDPVRAEVHRILQIIWEA